MGNPGQPPPSPQPDPDNPLSHPPRGPGDPPSGPDETPPAERDADNARAPDEPRHRRPPLTSAPPPAARLPNR